MQLAFTSAATSWAGAGLTTWIADASLQASGETMSSDGAAHLNNFMAGIHKISLR
jgi:hypothetical protein